MNSNAFTAQEIATLTKRLAQLQDEAEDVLRQKLKRKLWGHILTKKKTVGSHLNNKQMLDGSGCARWVNAWL
jgi:hypothetical protein